MPALPIYLRAVVAALCLAGPVGCAWAGDLTVSAASSLTQAFKDVAALFEARHPGTRVRLNFGASGALLQQIAKGAPVDVLATADQATLDQAQSQSLVNAVDRRDFVSNRLVVVVPTASEKRPKTLSDLAQPAWARVAIGVPASVPVGRYTVAVLERAGLWKAIEPRMIGAHNVRQALDYVARGEVDAGFVYATDAALMPDKVSIAMVVPTDIPVRYPIAPLAASAHPEAARRFAAFVLTEPAQAVFARHGFGKP